MDTETLPKASAAFGRPLRAEKILLEGGFTKRASGRLHFRCAHTGLEHAQRTEGMRALGFQAALLSYATCVLYTAVSYYL